MGASLLIYLILPFVHTSRIKSSTFRPLAALAFWAFIGNFICLIILGGRPVEEPFVSLSIYSLIFYFTYFLILVPVIGIIENVTFKSRNL